MKKLLTVFMFFVSFTAFGESFPSGMYEYSYTKKGDVAKGESPIEYTFICTLSIDSNYYSHDCEDIEDYDKAETEQYLNERRKRVVWTKKDDAYISNEYDNIIEIADQFLRCRVHLNLINNTQIGFNSTCIDFRKKPNENFPDNPKDIEYDTYMKID